MSTFCLGNFGHRVGGFAAGQSESTVAFYFTLHAYINEKAETLKTY
jgi:hypothetical protein